MQAALFRDRAEAGRQLGERLAAFPNEALPIVLALPCGGVPVGLETARALPAELDIFVVRKLGLPGQPELAIGALASGGVRVLNQPLIDQLRLSERLIDSITAREQIELQRREEMLRGERGPANLRGRTIILVRSSAR